jgi:hypothetical protein
MPYYSVFFLTDIFSSFFHPVHLKLESLKICLLLSLSWHKPSFSQVLKRHHLILFTNKLLAYNTVETLNFWKFLFAFYVSSYLSLTVSSSHQCLANWNKWRKSPTYSVVQLMDRDGKSVQWIEKKLEPSKRRLFLKKTKFSNLSRIVQITSRQKLEISLARSNEISGKPLRHLFPLSFSSSEGWLHLNLDFLFSFSSSPTVRKIVRRQISSMFKSLFNQNKIIWRISSFCWWLEAFGSNRHALKEKRVWGRMKVLKLSWSFSLFSHCSLYLS